MINRKARGFTLIEIIIVLALTPIILGAIYTAVTVSYRVFFGAVRLSNVQGQSKNVVNILTQEIKTSRFFTTSQDAAKGLTSSYFDNIPGDKVIYIEGYDSKRYIYSFETNNGKRQLYKYTYEDLGANSYSVDEDVKYLVTPYEYSVYTSSSNKSNRITTGIGSQVKNMPAGYDSDFIYYDEGEENYYLFVKEHGTGEEYRFLLEVQDSLDSKYTFHKSSTPAKKLVSYVTELIITENDNGKCDLYVKAVDGGKTKAIKTVVDPLFDHRGDF